MLPTCGQKRIRLAFSNPLSEIHCETSTELGIATPSPVASGFQPRRLWNSTYYRPEGLNSFAHFTIKQSVRREQHAAR